MNDRIDMDASLSVGHKSFDPKSKRRSYLFYWKLSIFGSNKKFRLQSFRGSFRRHQPDFFPEAKKMDYEGQDSFLDSRGDKKQPSVQRPVQVMLLLIQHFSIGIGKCIGVSFDG